LVETCLSAAGTLRAFGSWVSSLYVARDAYRSRCVHNFLDIGILGLILWCFENRDIFLEHSVNVPSSLIANPVDPTLRVWLASSSVLIGLVVRLLTCYRIYRSDLRPLYHSDRLSVLTLSNSRLGYKRDSSLTFMRHKHFIVKNATVHIA